MGLQHLITGGSPEALRLNDAEFGTKQDSHCFVSLAVCGTEGLVQEPESQIPEEAAQPAEGAAAEAEGL